MCVLNIVMGDYMFKRILKMISIPVIFSAAAVMPVTADTKTNSAAKEPFHVIGVTPQGELPSQVKYPSIQIQFSQPVVALKALGEPMSKSDIVTIEPKLNGTFRWKGTSVLSFDSTEETVPQKEYTIKISPATKSAKGEPITGTLSYSFHTEELKLLNIRPAYAEVKDGNWVNTSSVPLEAARDIGVFFNAPVNCAVVQKYIEVTDGKGRRLGFTAVEEDRNAVRLTLAQKPDEDTDILVTLKKGAMADKDCYPTSEDRQKKFHTLVTFKVTNVDWNTSRYDDKQTEHPVYITFSSILKQDSQEQAAAFISTSLGTKVTAQNIAVNGRTLTVSGLPVKHDDKYKLFIAKGLTDIWGRELDRDYSYDVTVPSLGSYAVFQNSGFKAIESCATPAVTFYHQNVKAGSYYEVIPLTGADGGKPSKKRASFVLDPERIAQDERITQVVDLRPFLDNVNGEYRGAVKFHAHINYEYKWGGRRNKDSEYKIGEMDNEQILQVTDLGISARYAYNKAAVHIAGLKDGKSIANAAVYAYIIPDYKIKEQQELLTGSYTGEKHAVASARTNKDGLAEFDLSKAYDTHKDGVFYFEAVTDSDRVLFTPNYRYYHPFRIGNEAQDGKQMVTNIFSDRKLYKPGETVSLYVIDRNLNRNGTYSVPDGDERNYSIELKENYSYRSKTYWSGNGKLDGEGTACATFKLPEDIKPGDYPIVFKRICGGMEQTQQETITVQYFEKLRFEAKSSVAKLTYIKGDSLAAEIEANYLGGGSMGGASFRALWSSEGTRFVPKNDDYKGMSFCPAEQKIYYRNHGNENGSLNDDGTARCSHSTGDDEFDARPRSYKIETQITDAGNQAINTVATALVHPSKFYIGIGDEKNKKGFPKKGESVNFLYTAITPDETKPSAKVLPKDGKLQLELTRENWKTIQEMNDRGVVTTRWERELITEEKRDIPVPSSLSPAKLTVKPKDGGTYKLRLAAKDSDGNDVIAERTFYVISSDCYHRGNRGEEITLKADKEEYQVGDTAQILMETELPKGRYLLCIEREGIIEDKVVSFGSPASVIEVPIQDSYVPVVYVSVSSYSDETTKTDKAQPPKSYYGVTALNVSTKSKEMSIELITDQTTYEPGGKVSVSIRATKDGKAVPNARLALMAVDRGVIDLIDYHVANPLTHFYNSGLFYNRVAGGDSRSLLIAQQEETEEAVVYQDTMNGRALVMMKSAAAPKAAYAMEMADDTGSGTDESDGTPKVRKNFNPTAYFNADIKTDSKGKASVTFTLPDSITAYRLTAVCVKGDSFGLREGEINAAEPISARPVVPRVLRLDDESEAGVTISNLRSKASSVTVTAEVFDGVEMAGITQDKNAVQKLPGKASVTGKKSKTLKVGANETLALLFDIKAQKAGWVTLAFTLKGKDINEQLLLPLEIQKPYIFETVATTGSTEDMAREVIVLPGNAEDNRGSLYVQLDPTRLGVLREAVSYVFHYPYGCLEQRSAAVLPLAAFGDYIKIFGLESEVCYPKGVAEGEIRAWASSQKSDGGFPYWPGGMESSPYVSMRIAEILAVAKENGIPTGSIRRDDLASYLVRYADDLTGKYPESGWALYSAAYAYYAASQIGAKATVSKLDAIMNADNSDIEALALTGMTYQNLGETAKAEQTATKLRSFMRLTARGIDITGKNEGHYWCFFNDSSEKYALCLQFFTRQNAKDSINQHLVYELLKLQRASKGYWKSTAATSRVLIALNRYIKDNDLEHLDFTAQVLLGGKELLQGSFKGVAAEATDRELDFDSTELKGIARDKEIDLDFTKTGTGTLYYTACMRYAIPADKQKARDEGICVYTEITDAETGEAVSTNELTAGKLYREKVYVSSTINLEYVALRASVPAGAEILNDAFVTTISAPRPEPDDTEAKRPWWNNYNRGLSYKKIYDDEIQYFWNYLPRGSQNVEFVFRATRKGTYNTPCVSAECMYEEEIFGRSDGAVWKIK